MVAGAPGTRRAGGDRLDDEQVDAVHCRIQGTFNGFTLIDDGSATGTLIRGERVTKRDLVDADVIVIGATRIAFKSTV